MIDDLGDAADYGDGDNVVGTNNGNDDDGGGNGDDDDDDDCGVQREVQLQPQHVELGMRFEHEKLSWKCR